MELVQEILEIARWWLFVAFQPKQVSDMVITKSVHARAKTWLVRQISSTFVEFGCGLNAELFTLVFYGARIFDCKTA